ncbi:hypothetical protein SASPL_126027 [Salvia splendens]|uniref:NB-ARC domain-containing protein n=1 Tax=Salvia splendens TaxID=180675 RepID=A0A8X8XGX4_SALSN|nr:hypothetical protein SASPL_126027 [Salvia splendens]
MDRKVIRSDWSMVDALNGRNYREVDWSMINLLFDSSKSKRSINRRAIGALDAQIRDTTWKLEDVIQSHVLSFPLFHPLGDIFSFLEIESGLINEYIIELEEHNKNSDTMEQEIHSFSKTVNMLEKEYIAELCTPLHREEDETVVLPADKFGGENSIVIGLFDQIEQIRNELLDLQSGNQVVSLFGMAGIGKTRLAREIYQDQITVQHFDYTAWLSIGPSNEMGDILADIVSQIERKPIDVYIEEDRYTLAMFLQRCLQGRSCTDDVFKSIPNLKKLGISIDLLPDGAETLSLENIGILNQLVSLKCVVVNPHVTTQIGYSWKYMSPIGWLPILKVLKLRCSAFRGAEWKPGDGEFPRLEYLLLEDMDLVKWAIRKDNQSLIFYQDSFQNLQHLIIRHCFKLREIPWRIGDIRSLKRMEVVDCGPSVIASAEQIQKKRSSVQLLIESSWKL